MVSPPLRVVAPAALAVLVSASGVRAQETGRFRLAWSRDDGADRCPAQPELAREVARRLGRDPWVTGEGPSIEASVRREGSRWLARVVVRDAADRRVGAREFSSAADECAPIAAAVALGVALAVDPDAALRPPAPEPAPPVPPPVEPQPPAPQPPARRAREDVWTRAAGVSLRAVVGFGMLPEVAPGLALSVEGPITGRLRWAAGMTWLPEVDASRQGRAVVFGRVTGSLGACVDAVRTAGLSVAGCAGFAAGALHAVVVRGDPGAPGEVPWASFTAGLRLRGRVIGRLAAEVGVEGEVPFLRHRFYVGGSGDTVFQPWPVTVTAFGGVGVQFR